MKPVMDQDALMQQMLATALRGEEVVWPAERAMGEIDRAVVEQAFYHGVAGLLVEQAENLVGWPQEVVEALREQARALAMWEMRHKLVLANLLTALAHEGIVAIVLKGTALAYDLYENPATRARGDTDILVAKADLDHARSILRELGFNRDATCPEIPGEMHLQEMWPHFSEDGSRHEIDLHWQTMNFPALDGILSFADCSRDLQKLRRLCDAALGMDRVNMLVHACVHRAKHLLHPYFIEGEAYFGGDRLIWAQDIHLLANALSDPEWADFYASAEQQGVAVLCLEGLWLAQARLGTVIPAMVLEKLAAAPSKTRATTYLLHSGQFARAWSDTLAVPGIRRRLSFLFSRAFPSQAFMRARYPSMQSHPVILLHFWRLLGPLRAPSRRGKR